jgi:hypothetical protein
MHLEAQDSHGSTDSVIVDPRSVMHVGTAARLILTTAVILLLVVTALACALPSRALAATPGDTSFAGALTTTGPTPPSGVLAPLAARSALSGAGEVLLSGVPSYMWRDGCTPTAAGMLVGYYDAHGFPDLIAGDASTETAAARQAIASHGSAADPRHYEDYALPMDEDGPILADESEDPDGNHADDSLADFMQTSFSARELAYGWTYTDMVGPAVRDFAALGEPTAVVTYRDYDSYGSGLITFAAFKAEIDAGRPMVLSVDSSGFGDTDHSVLGIGYRETAGYPEYACRDTWYSAVRWSRFQVDGKVQKFEVFGGTAITFTAADPAKDVTSPVTMVAGATDSWTAKPVTLTFTASDSGSGVDRVEAGVDVDEVADPAALVPLAGDPPTLVVSGQGTHRVSYRAVDKQGNVEPTRTCAVRIDGVAPATSVRAAAVRRGSRVTLRYRIDDLTPKASVRLVVRTRSGRARATLRPGWRATGTLQRATWRAKLPRGVYRVWVYATDQAGNRQVKAGSARLTIR